MVQQQNILSIPTIWRGKKFVLELSSQAPVLELGQELQKLTDVKADTLRLIVPQSSGKSSKLLMPFSDEHSSISLQDAGIINGKPLRMMGVLENEVDQLLKDSQAKLRIAGFEEEERRMKERLSKKPQHTLKLPPGPYIFCDFRTLEIPGIELNPPPSEALKRMHMLAADPGIVAIMNKHRWRVGIMTEMAPEGYVGISPVCLLGLNKNHGEEISLRLRTDDLNGFRKYASIKKTLLHELAHMVHSEHDENFYALDKQLNQEAFALDWTLARSHTLANSQFYEHDDMDMDFQLESNLPQKLGGEISAMPASARVAAITAAYRRLAESSTISDENKLTVDTSSIDNANVLETMEPDPDDTDATNNTGNNFVSDSMNEGKHSQLSEAGVACDHPDEDTTGPMPNALDRGDMTYEPDPDDTAAIDSTEDNTIEQMPNAVAMGQRFYEPDPDDTDDIKNLEDNIIGQTHGASVMDTMTYEPDPDDEELRRIQDPVTKFCSKLTQAIQMLQNELNPPEVMVVQQTLFKIMRNVSENPNEMKYKRLRKANPTFQRSIANSKAALDVLFLIGFVEEVVTDEMGKIETYMVLKRNDPGLLWLAKSSLETAFASS
ncbi:hypothetical protein KSS87_014600 [Heliosperma pusillum]|nr:hypothetical protein KSS87_014600 [Heliosperma pusillum]